MHHEFRYANALYVMVRESLESLEVHCERAK